MKTLNERVDDLENKYEFMEKGIANLAVNVVRLRTEMETRFSTLETRFDTLETRFGALEKRFNVMETRFGALETKVDRILDILTGDR